MALSPPVNVVAPLELITSEHHNAVRANLVDDDTQIGRLQADTGWVVQTQAGGFTTSNTHVRRQGGIVTINIAGMTYGGGGVTDTDVLLFTISDVAARPTTAIYGAVYCTLPKSMARLSVAPTTGQVRSNPLTMTTGAILYGSISYPVNLA